MVSLLRTRRQERTVLRIGVDVGGTNTDAVILKDNELLAAHKAPTTSDIQTGVIAAIRAVLEQAGIGADRVDGVMIGTTQFTNAFVEGARLQPVGVMRLSLPAATGIPPLYAWPPALFSKVHGESVMLAGGYEFDGREISPLDEAGVRAAARDFRVRGLTCIAISSPFSPVNSAMERRAAAIVAEEHPGATINISSAFSRMGLIERENAAVMNASLAQLATKVVSSFQGALRDLGISAPFFISQNDGTLMDAEAVRHNPVLTFASGPTNSMRGAAYLTGLSDAIVVDIGGTTSDIGVLVGSFPRESSIAVDIGGVRTNFRTPDILSLGLGGGSLVRHQPSVTVGPDSVGYRIHSEAMVFGGTQLTATDIAVAAGYAAVGERSRVSGIDTSLIARAVDEIHTMIEVGIDRMKTSGSEVPLILVGGGSILIHRPLKGVGELHIPEHAGVANAVGAAIAQVSGEVDTIISYADCPREQALASVQRQATERAVAAGADPGSLKLVELEDIPLSYLPGSRARIRAKVVGDLRLANHHRVGTPART
jgi:N-methylhydantoinase A/oxoprolinase/acetone carboxylase beta subunit